MGIHFVAPEVLDFDHLRTILSNDTKLALSEDAGHRVIRCRQYLDDRIADHEEPIYGVTTGFGSLCNRDISRADLGVLQRNLVMSHACGMGDEVPEKIVRLMLFLKIQSLAYGHSAIRLETLERLIDFFNNKMYPVVYNQGSLGASGDLAPLAHLSLPLLGLGEMKYEGHRYRSAELLDKMGWQPLELTSKEGLALLNGTQFMLAYGTYVMMRAQELLLWADLIGAMSLEAYMGRIEAFYEQVHKVRHHKGQIQTAENIRKILKGSELLKEKRRHVQDPYSFRCMPQIHGASKDAIAYVSGVFANEMNAVTDNPTLFPDDDLIISAGNFHGQPLAISLDFLGIALAELASISERRIYRLIEGKRKLPSFLVANPGLNSGFMIPQYTAAAIVSQNKQLCSPASVDTIESSQGQEDHVSMGANAAVKSLSIVENLEKVLAIELMTACQAIEFREAEKTSHTLGKLLKAFRENVSFIQDDKVMYEEMNKARAFIHSHSSAVFL
jgi:histidine ammonia-lyase